MRWCNSRAPQADIRRITGIKEGEEVIGNRVRVKVVKNKVAPPFRMAEFDLMHSCGISTEGDLLDIAIEDRIVEKSGAWFSYNGEKIGQGRENAKQWLRDNPKVVEVIRRQILEKRGLVQPLNGQAIPSEEEVVVPTKRGRAVAAE